MKFTVAELQRLFTNTGNYIDGYGPTLRDGYGLFREELNKILTTKLANAATPVKSVLAELAFNLEVGLREYEQHGEISEVHYRKLCDVLHRARLIVEGE